MYRRVIFLVLACLLPVSAPAQQADQQTFADIRADLTLLKEQIVGLRNELITTRPAETGVENAAPLLVRVDQLEADVQRLNGKLEELGFRLEQVVADGTNRVGDLEFRLLELEGGDFSELGDTPPLGTMPAPAATASGNTGAQPLIDQTAAELTDALRPRPRPGAGGEAMASVTDDVSNVTDTTVPQPQPAADPFEQALGAYRSGRFAEAVTAFDGVIASNPGGPRVAEAAFWRGEALAAQGNWNAAARSYLDSFSGAPQGTKAPEALLRLGISLGRLGQVNEACMTLNEVSKRFPDAAADVSSRTSSELRALSCS